jgi:cell division protein ZapA (FtsZ GTPase activity inhibitor)
MGSGPATSTEVEIFGAVYSVRGGQDREHLQGLAKTVDRTMRDISGRVATGDPTRIAILAALNLADELFQCQRRQEGEREKITETVATLTGELRRALEG